MKVFEKILHIQAKSNKLDLKFHVNMDFFLILIVTIHDLKVFCLKNSLFIRNKIHFRRNLQQGQCNNSTATLNMNEESILKEANAIKLKPSLRLIVLTSQCFIVICKTMFIKQFHILIAH